MVMLQFDRARVDTLRLALGATLDELRAIRSSDPAAADVMRAIGGSCRTLSDVWLPRIHDILNSTAMTSCTRSAPGVPDVAQATRNRALHHVGWEQINDPLPVFGPPAPHLPNGDEVLAAIASGALQPMEAPLDANGRAGGHYTSLAFAPSTPPVEIGHVDLTSNAAKIADFLSDAMPVGWHEVESLDIYRLDNVRVTKSFHTLGAYDSKNGPDTLVNLTQEATMSGYMVIIKTSGLGEVTLPIGVGDGTQSRAIISESSSSDSGIFYPINEPDFEPVDDEPRFVNPDLWTFTKSASPMVDGWGTWQT